MRFSLSQLSVWHPPSALPVSRPLKQAVISRCSSRLSVTENSLNSVGNGGITDSSSNGSTHCEVLRNVKNQCCDSCFRRKCLIDGVSANVFHVYHDMNGIKLKLSAREYSKDDGFVTGFYLQHGDRPSDRVIFWLYGGAFLSGDSKGNINIGKLDSLLSLFSYYFLIV